MHTSSSASGCARGRHSAHAHDPPVHRRAALGVGAREMTNIARKSDGRRIFTDEFKREQIRRVWRGEVSIAGLSRKLGIARSLLQRWKRLVPQDGITRDARLRRTPAARLRTDEYIRELQLLVGKQTVELELLRTELDALKKGRRSQGASRR